VTGPKTVTILVDVSGSMQNSSGITTKVSVALSATVTVLNTLAMTDWVSIVLFSDSVTSYSSTLVQANDANIALMIDFLSNNPTATGYTDFITAINQA